MSIAKKRAQKSLNQSNLSQLSNSQNIRESSIFKNYALLQVQNISGNNQSKSSRKQALEQHSNKKKQAVRRQCNEHRMKSKQNQKSKENKATINYSGLAKIVEEKNIVINNQQRQIQNLKCSLQRVRKQLQLTRVDFDKKKLEDLANLKRQQEDNEQNIKELEVLRVGMRQLKNRIQSLQLQKAHLSKKSHQYLQQNEELTIKLTTLKQEYSQNYLPSQQTITALTYELNILKQQQKQTKELQAQKSGLEQRCRSLERKINEYVLRYNEVQSQYNETQIKYYRAQKQNDDLKMHVEELEIQNRNVKKMLEEEKKITSQMMDKWKARIMRLQDVNKTGRDKKYNAVIEIQERCAKLEQVEVQAKVQEKNVQIGHLQTKIALLSSEIELLKCEITNKRADKQIVIEGLRRQLTSLLLQKEELEKIHNLETETIEKQLQKIVQLQKKISLSQSEVITLKKQIQSRNKFLRTKELGTIELQDRVFYLESKITLFKTQVEQKSKHITKLQSQISHKNIQISKMNETNVKISQDLKQVVNILNLRGKQIEQESQNNSKAQQELKKCREEIFQKASQILVLQELQKSLRSQVASLESDLYLSQLNLKTMETSLHEKLTILQLNIKQLQGRNSEQNEQLALKNSQIKRMEAIITNTNAQLKEIRVIVGDYKQKIQESNDSILNGERKYQNQVHLMKEAQLKLFQQVNYYKNKYEENFKHNIQLSNNIRECQNQLVDQVNKNTELIKSISYLESQVQKTNQNKSVLEVLAMKEVQTHNAENGRLRSEIANYEQNITQLRGQIREIQARLASLVHQNTGLKQQNIKVSQLSKKSLQQNTIMEKQRHEREILQLTNRFEQENKRNMELEQLRFEKYTKMHKEQEAMFTIKLQQALKEIEEKNILLRQNYDIISQKEGQIQNMRNFKFAIESQQVKKVKEYNFTLIRQSQETSLQLNKSYQELREVAEQSQKYRTSINHLQREIIVLQNRNIQLGNEINSLRCTAFQHNEENTRTITELRCHISTCEEKIKCQTQQIGLWMQKYESTDKQLKKIQHECSKVSRNYLEESNRKNKQNGREIENYRTQIKLLQEQNINLQKIMDKELGKRKIIIQQLIHEKKMLYEQIGH